MDVDSSLRPGAAIFAERTDPVYRPRCPRDASVVCVPYAPDVMDPDPIVAVPSMTDIETALGGRRPVPVQLIGPAATFGLVPDTTRGPFTRGESSVPGAERYIQFSLSQVPIPITPVMHREFLGGAR